MTPSPTAAPRRQRAGNSVAQSLTAEAYQALLHAFEDFQSRADKLGQAYRAMQDDFKRVNLELDQRNRELADSLKKQQEMQTYLSSILESMNNGVIGIDVMGRITHFNCAAALITGYSYDEVIGKPYVDYFDQVTTAQQSLVRVLEAGEELQRNEKVLWDKNGHPVPVSFQSARLRDNDGAILGAVEIFSDISRIKALEEEMQRTKTMAVLGEMAATVAHEIRNPLGAMGVWAGLLERELDAQDSRRTTVRRIIEGLSRLNRIVSNLLVYSRPVKAALRDMPLADLLNEIIDFVAIEIERKEQKVAVRKQWSDLCSLRVKADPEKLQQVVMNLCLNAVQAMPHGGTLSVIIDEEPSDLHSGYVSFRVVDTGIGIERENLDKVCDPFYTTKENGTGLGLAIVKKIVAHHSGHMTIESVPNQGTAVRIFLPSTRSG